ncbi:MAG: UDP-N-acetylmuramoyl-L-alanyl-D-glutamate--2,6-diaminopimelate ligase [Erysipelotrichaceae bacterium]|nr:UDP-N-acetylmuramoyl-L-alanyl-D-glutamate--2,6-diaminopimelate ligase [Erysipelotrichaceae bacterium]
MKIRKVFDTQSDLDIRNIMFDSRIESQDSIFFAMKGKINDGHKFIDKAIENGARCIVYTDDISDIKEGIEYIKVEDAVKAYVSFCNAFYDYPLQKMNVIGITGTNGKTTIAWIIRSIISKFEKCGYIGTMGYYYGTEIKNSKMNLTSPKSDELFRIGKEMADYGCKALVMEASSEGLYYNRLDEVVFSTALFNNLTGDHFDIHGDMESYFKAKCLLFDKLSENGKAIINIDDEYGKRLYDMLKVNRITYAIDSEADYRAVNIQLFNNHSEFDLLYKDNTYHINTNMPARFNIYNLLGVIAVLNENGYGIEEIMPYICNVELTPGRCQLIDEGQNFNVVVDYAFTPNSFDKVFSFAESITSDKGKIIAVFGAAGNRDHLRRPGTAKVADERADEVILTYDDPSREDMMGILVDLKSYFSKLNPEIILDRIEAIDKAVDIAEEGDTILLLGKGNDKFFLCAQGRVPYISDETAARNAIRKKLAKNS